MRLGDTAKMNIDVIPTGFFPLTLPLAWGMPTAGIIEVYGPESSGKTTVALHIVAEAQKLGGTAAFIDAEHALDPNMPVSGDINGVDFPTGYGRTGTEICEALDLRSNSVDIIVIDSVATRTPVPAPEGKWAIAIWASGAIDVASA